MPPAITAAAQQAVAGARTTFGRLAGLESQFRLGNRYTVASDDDAPAGHGLFQIGRLLQDRTGTAEQYASAFAVMARGLGYDARLVIGFRAPFDRDVDGWVVRSRAVQVWPEVRLAGLRWVGFQPTPTTRSDGSEEPRAADAGRSAVDQAVRQEQAARQAPPASPPPARPDEDGRGQAAPWALVIGALVAVLAVGLLGVLLVPLVKLARRRSRRLRPDPRDRVLGAWREAADRLTEHGLPASGALSRPEVVTAVARREPSVAEPLRSLAPCSPTTPVSPRAARRRVPTTWPGSTPTRWPGPCAAAGCRPGCVPRSTPVRWLGADGNSVVRAPGAEGSSGHELARTARRRHPDRLGRRARARARRHRSHPGLADVTARIQRGGRSPGAAVRVVCTDGCGVGALEWLDTGALWR